MKSGTAFGMLLRYLLIVIAGLNGLYIFYAVFTPLTLNILSLFFQVNGNIISTSSAVVELVPACIAGSAYYLLFILLFATPNIGFEKRLRALVFLFASFLVLNSLRIILLVSVSGMAYFNEVHLLFWYLVSTLFVVGLWIAAIKVFRIKDVPFYADMALLFGMAKKSKRQR
jgi:hypothetical protein